MSNTDKITVLDIKNETFTLVGIDDLQGLDHLKKDMLDRGYHDRHYLLARNVEGTRKKPYTVTCIRGIRTSEFKKAF